MEALVPLIDALPSDPMLRIIFLVVVVGVLWFVLRFVLGLAKRIFTLGCGLILAFGLILILIRYLN